MADMAMTSCINRMSLLGSTILNELALISWLIRKLTPIIILNRIKAVEFFASLSLLVNCFIIGHILAMFGL